MLQNFTEISSFLGGLDISSFWRNITFFTRRKCFTFPAQIKILHFSGKYYIFCQKYYFFFRECGKILHFFGEMFLFLAEMLHF